MEDFPNINKILDFLLANLGILDKSMITRDLRLLGIQEMKDLGTARHFLFVAQVGMSTIRNECSV